ncbi:hypothetical protein QR680_010270 [Steinernema hermaphroditum]|uniref:ShKT domain-containing protein n=1 Tax=Steinernema hermaphroditum TaxID=289476 RepID=A0AA39MAD9_9BILA|nr:hypothetical protein QR680_010270 [Steinernema hermaphroditum]
MGAPFVLIPFFFFCATVYGQDCVDGQGNLIPSATMCEDEAEECALIFRTPLTFEPASRDPFCSNVIAEDIDDIRMKCAKSCGLCCERPEVRDTCQDSAFLCTKFDATQCKIFNPAGCPVTCGTCPTTTTHWTTSEATTTTEIITPTDATSTTEVPTTPESTTATEPTTTTTLDPTTTEVPTTTEASTTTEIVTTSEATTTPEPTTITTMVPTTTEAAATTEIITTSEATTTPEPTTTLEPTSTPQPTTTTEPTTIATTSTSEPTSTTTEELTTTTEPPTTSEPTSIVTLTSAFETSTSSVVSSTVAVASSSTNVPTNAPSLHCTDAKGILLESAQNCPDVYPDCASTFPLVAQKNPAIRDPKCTNPMHKDAAMMCSKTCALCCENEDYNCEDNPMIDCNRKELKEKCFDPTQQSTNMIVQLCPHTCGLCQQSRCKDSLDICPYIAVLCEDAKLGPVVQQQCSFTCGSCPFAKTTTTPAPPSTTTAPPQPLRCTGADGVLLPTAQNCPDLYKDCTSSFPTVATQSPASRDPKCNDPNLKEASMMCAQTCAICCEHPDYKCADAPDYYESCASLKHLCAGPSEFMRLFMTMRCAHTCGLCAQADCKDNLPECPAMKEMCNDPKPEFAILVQQQCAFTCGTCPSEITSTTLVPTTIPTTTTTAAPPTTTTAARTPPPQPRRCTGDDGTLLSTAQSCADIRPDCGDLFRVKATQNPASRDPLCNLKLLGNISMACARTCAICCEQPEVNCTDHPNYESTCRLMKSNCSSSNEEDRHIMDNYCPLTCGLCKSRKCIDKMADCPAMLTMCADPDHDAVRRHCPWTRTCGFCSVPTPRPIATCADKKPNCRGNRHNCQVPQYSEWMKVYCPLTCDYCTPPRVQNRHCWDQDDDCEELKKRGFCEDTYYTYDDRYNICGKTCGFC